MLKSMERDSNLSQKMKCLLYILVAVNIAIAIPLKNEEENYSRYVEFPDDNGVMQKVDLEQEPDMDFVNDYTRNAANNLYLLFTRRNPNSPQTLVINNANSVTSSNFNARVPTVVIVHGWRSNQNTDLNPRIRNAWLRRSDVNVIIMDWNRLAASIYNTAAAGVPGVGRGLGQFLAFLNRVTGAAFTNMHLVGFSLGAHIVGHAGRELNGRVVRITGLDPAGPNFYSSSNRLGPNDGVYVEAIHTNGGVLPNLGIGRAIANADFFPNGGSVQPGCNRLDVTCHHGRAWEFFEASISYNNFVGRRCNNMNEVNSNSCSGASLNMGNDNLNKRGTGIYRVNTGNRYPF